MFRKCIAIVALLLAVPAYAGAPGDEEVSKQRQEPAINAPPPPKPRPGTETIIWNETKPASQPARQAPPARVQEVLPPELSIVRLKKIVALARNNALESGVSGTTRSYLHDDGINVSVTPRPAKFRHDNVPCRAYSVRVTYNRGEYHYVELEGVACRVNNAGLWLPSNRVPNLTGRVRPERPRGVVYTTQPPRQYYQRPAPQRRYYNHQPPQHYRPPRQIAYAAPVGRQTVCQDSSHRSEYQRHGGRINWRVFDKRRGRSTISHLGGIYNEFIGGRNFGTTTRRQDCQSGRYASDPVGFKYPR